MLPQPVFADRNLVLNCPRYAEAPADFEETVNAVSGLVEMLRASEPLTAEEQFFLRLEVTSGR